MAEAQAAEELRRKDPVKRAFIVAGLLVFLVAIWASMLQFKIVSAKGELRGLESKWKSIEKGYQVAVESQRRTIEAQRKLSALHQLTTNRFLWGTALNAFQQALTGVDDVQVVRLKTEQTYFTTEETKTKSDDAKATSGKPATATERINFTVEAMDFSPQPGGSVNKFKESIANVPHFKGTLQKTNGVLLTSLSAPQVNAQGKPFVMFTLQCFFPEAVR